MDNELIELDVTEKEPVRNIVEQIRDKWGQENVYRLIYAGKVQKDGILLSEYRVTSTLPIIVLDIKPLTWRGKESARKVQNMKI